MSRLVGGVVGAAIVVGALFLVMFLGGLTSAALEVRAEKRAGLPVTRPAWERRAARKAAGGWTGTIRGIWKALEADRERKARACRVCGGMMIDDLDPESGPRRVCARDLNGDPESERLHDQASGVPWSSRFSGV